MIYSGNLDYMAVPYGDEHLSVYAWLKRHENAPHIWLQTISAMAWELEENLQAAKWIVARPECPSVVGVTLWEDLECVVYCERDKESVPSDDPYFAVAKAISDRSSAGPWPSLGLLDPNPNTRKVHLDRAVGAYEALKATGVSPAVEPPTALLAEAPTGGTLPQENDIWFLEGYLMQWVPRDQT